MNVKSFGTITFPRYYCNTARFIRISPDVDPIEVKKFIFGENVYRGSSLILSIQGSAKESNLRSKLFRIFREGLLKLAKNTDIWIITAGLNTRVTRFFGEIVRTDPNLSHRIHLIGIISWGCVSNVDQLDVQGTNVIYLHSKSDEKGLLALEANHTHLVFIDDGKRFDHSCALKYRGLLEKVLLNSRTNSNGSVESIPIVIIVIEGCADAIRKVHGSVMNCRIPVVFVEGTGGCCDLFAKCYHLYNEYQSKAELFDQTNDDTKIKNKLRQTLKIINHELAETSCTNSVNQCLDYFQLIYECVHQRNLCLNFLDLTLHTLTGDDVISSILQSLFKGNPSERSLETKLEQLNLAYQWRQIDIVTKSIIIHERDWQRIDLNDLFERSLKENQGEFIQLFLDHDFALHDLFDHQSKLLQLYHEEDCCSTDELNGPLRSIYAETNQSLIGNFFQLNAIFNLKDLPRDTSKEKRRCLISPSQSIRSETDISKHLFIWAILTDKRELGLLFWTRGRNKICAALIGVLVNQNKARKEKNHQYKQWADQWEELAVDILEKFSQTNPRECQQAILRPVPEFGYVTWLQLAVMAQSKLFLAKSIVQEVLTDIWRGHMDYDVGIPWIVASTFVPFYAAFLPYSEELLTKDELTQDQLADEIESNSLDEASPMQRKSIPANQPMKKISMFLHSPRVKYLYNLYSRVIFLLLFSYVMLFDYYPLYSFQSDRCFVNDDQRNHSNTNVRRNLKRGPAITEIVLLVWVFALFCESIREIMTMKIRSISRKIEVYLAIFWNKLNAVCILLFIIGCLLRFLPCHGCFCSARIVLAVALSLWYIRSLDVFSAVKILGPKLVMIGEMVYDLSFFMLIITVFILAFGVPTYSLLHDVQKFSWHIPRQIINLAYWEIFGELDTVEDVKKNYEIHGYVMFGLLLAYTIIASVLLINLLIAMFSNTFNQLHLDTDNLWKFQQYSLVCDYLSRPLLPPPLIVLNHLWRMISYLSSKICKSKWFYIKHEDRNKLKRNVNQKLARQIEEIEDALGHEVYFFNHQKGLHYESDPHGDQLPSSERIVVTKMKTIENQVQALQNQQSKMIHHLQCEMNEFPMISCDNNELAPLRDTKSK